jgi:hypothetical protein
MKEICICAAVKDKQGNIWRGQRHGDCMIAIINAEREIDNGSQGFMTSRNRFVDRHEGFKLQKEAGIKSVAIGGYRGEILFSEDLY